MKILTIEDYKPIDKTRVSEVHSHDGPPNWGWVGLEPDDDGNSCWICGNQGEWMIRLKKIGDWYNEMICAECIDKLKTVLDELRSP